MESWDRFLMPEPYAGVQYFLIIELRLMQDKSEDEDYEKAQIIIYVPAIWSIVLFLFLSIAAKNGFLKKIRKDCQLFLPRFQ